MGWIWTIATALMVPIGILLLTVFGGAELPQAGLATGSVAIGTIAVVVVLKLGFKKDLGPDHFILMCAAFFLAALAISGAGKYFEIPESWKEDDLQKHPLGIFFSKIGVEKDWLYWPALLYLFIIPFLCLFAIIEGFLRILEEVFGKWIHIISFCIAFILIPIGIFTRIVQALFAAIGVYALGGFALLAFFAIIAGIIRGMGAMGFTASKTYRGLIKETELESDFEEMMRSARGYRELLIQQGKKEEAVKLANAIIQAHHKFYDENKTQEACEIIKEALGEAKKALEKG